MPEKVQSQLSSRCGDRAVILMTKLSSDALVVCAGCGKAVGTWRCFIESLNANELEKYPPSVITHLSM